MGVPLSTAPGAFFNEVNSAGKAVGGVLGILHDTQQGLTGDGFHYGDVGRDFTNSFRYWARSEGGSDAAFPIEESPQQEAAEQAQAQLKQLKNISNPESFFNAKNWKSVSTTGSNVAYGRQAKMNNLVKPSDLMSISDPQAKIFKSSLNSNQQTLWNGQKNNFDIAMSSSLSTANNNSPGMNVVKNNIVTSGAIPPSSSTSISTSNN